MAEDSIVNASIQPDEESANPLSDSQSDSESESEGSYEDLNHGQTPKKNKETKETKKEAQGQNIKSLYKANKETHKAGSKPKKEEAKGGEKKYVIKPNPRVVRTAIIPNPGYKQFIREKELEQEQKRPKKAPATKPEAKTNKPKTKQPKPHQTTSIPKTKTSNTGITKENRTKIETDLKLKLDKILKKSKEEFPGEKKKLIKKLVDLVY